MDDKIDNKIKEPIDNKIKEPIDDKIKEPIDDKTKEPIDDKSKDQDPLGIESMMKMWTQSMNELMSGSNFPGSSFKEKSSENFFSLFQTPFNPFFYQQQFTPPFQNPFQTLSQNPFQMPSQNSFQTLFQNPFLNSYNLFNSSNADEPSKNQFKWFFNSDESENKNPKRKDVLSAISNAMKNWQIIAGIISSPEASSSFFKGLGAMPEIFINMTSSALAGMNEIHQKLAESAGRIGQSVQAYKFEDIDENLFKALASIYEKEFRKFLKIPQLGLAREYQEKINDMSDKLNIFQTNIAEMLRLLSLPFQRSAVVMQEEIQELAEKGKLSEDPQFYYQMWVKVLEGHFMTLFQTPEYVDALNKTLSSLSEFSMAKNKVLEDMLKSLPIASRSEVDDMAKELYLLKKEIRSLKKKIS